MSWKAQIKVVQYFITVKCLKDISYFQYLMNSCLDLICSDYVVRFKKATCILGKFSDVDSKCSLFYFSLLADLITILPKKFWKQSGWKWKLTINPQLVRDKGKGKNWTLSIPCSVTLHRFQSTLNTNYKYSMFLSKYHKVYFSWILTIKVNHHWRS